MNRTVVCGGLLFCLAAGPIVAAAQQPPAAQRVAMTFGDFLARVGRSNLDLAAQRTNITIAEAEISIARIFPDPSMTGGLASVDVSRLGAPTVTILGVSQLIELGGKRRARVRAATAQRTVAQADAEDFLRVLRANAAGAFIDAVAARLELEQKRRSLDSLQRLVAVNEQRLKSGDIGEVALIKTRVEAQQFKSDVLAAAGDLQAAELELALQIGDVQARGLVPQPLGELKLPARDFSEAQLIANAFEHRPDLMARRWAVGAADLRVDLASANRSIDLGISVGWQHSGPATGGFQQPAFESVGGTLTIPLPFSRLYRGELQGAQAARAQARLLLGSAELRVQIEVSQALARYRAAAGRVQLYDSGTVVDAQRVFEATMYNYQRGGASLLEVLDAQRILNDVYLSYFDALRAHARALVEVETAAAMWDIDRI